MSPGDAIMVAFSVAVVLFFIFVGPYLFWRSRD